MESLKKILLRILNYLVILVLILVIVGVLLNKGGAPTIMGYKVLTVLTGSMEPELNVGTLILVKETPIKELKIEDIITYKTENNSSLVTHRIVEINEDGSLITKGDANNTEDIGEVGEEQVQGKIIFKVSRLGGIMIFLKENIVFVIILLTLILFIPEIVFKIQNSKFKSQN